MQRVRNAHPARALSLERCPHTKTFTPTNEWSKIAAKALTYPPQLACGEGLPHAFRLTAESGPSALPPPATGMYAREHGLLPLFPWSGRDSGGVRGVPTQRAAVVHPRAVALSRARFGYTLTCGVCSPCGKGIYRVAHSTVSWVDHTNDLDGHPRLCEALRPVQAVSLLRYYTDADCGGGGGCACVLACYKYVTNTRICISQTG